VQTLEHQGQHFFKQGQEHFFN